MIDTHAHLYAEEFSSDIESVIENAQAVGVEQVLLPNIDFSSLKALKHLTTSHPNYFKKMVGLHPCSVGNDHNEQLSSIKAEIDNETIAIGEIGLDFFWDKTFVKEQEDAFLIQCGWAKERNLPIAIHSRDSTDRIIDLIDGNYRNQISGVFHCFSGTHTQAKKIIDMGYYLGIGGVVTFKNSGLREELRGLPLERIVLETDAPYLAPVPYRGKRNESAYIREVAEVLSGVFEVAFDEIDAITTANAKELFNL